MATTSLQVAGDPNRADRHRLATLRRPRCPDETNTKDKRTVYRLYNVVILAYNCRMDTVTFTELRSAEVAQSFAEGRVACRDARSGRVGKFVPVDQIEADRRVVDMAGLFVQVADALSRNDPSRLKHSSAPWLGGLDLDALAEFAEVFGESLSLSLASSDPAFGDAVLDAQKNAVLAGPLPGWVTGELPEDLANALAARIA